MKISYTNIVKCAAIFRDFFLGALGLSCLAIAVVMTIADKLPAAGLLFTAGLLLSLFSSLSRFESIKGLGVEAKMAALDTKINEADVLLKHIRNTAGLMSEISFQVMARMGRWDSHFSKEESLALADTLKKQMQDLGMNDAEMNQKMASWHRTNVSDLAVQAYKELTNYIHIRNQTLSDEMRALPTAPGLDDPARAAINDSISKNGEFQCELGELWRSGSEKFVEHIEDLIQRSPIGTDREKDELIKRIGPRLADVRYYITNKTFRDRQEWLSKPYG